MDDDRKPAELVDFIDEELSGPRWEAWRAANPEQAAEVLLAARVRVLLRRMAELQVVAPPGFEARLMERVREERTLLDLLELALSGVGAALIEILNILFGMAPEASQSQPASVA